MKTIHKYRLDPVDEQSVPMPDGAVILSVQVQDVHVCVWATVDTGRPLVDRIIRLHGTGHELMPHPASKYIGTVQLHNGSLVLHAFDLGQE